MPLLYQALIHVLYLLLLAICPFYPKARLWITGRYGWRRKLAAWDPGDARVVWVHAASLGEFEQGRPLIEMIKSRLPHYRILLTFFSPSGYEVRKNYSGADLVLYLPLDTFYNARYFIGRVNPVAVFFVKYEFWPGFLLQLHRKGYPVYLISGIFRPKQAFFRWFGSWYRKSLHYFNFFFLQDDRSLDLLQQIGITCSRVTGDTRFDRVATVVSGAREVEIASVFAGDHFCLIGGSTWPEDEDILVPYINRAGPDMRFILAPHEITPAHLNRLSSQIRCNQIRYSEATLENLADKQVLIIDNIGMLSSLYRYGQIAYIGGGFGKGIHNILEAATFGIPVLFGPNYEKFKEAVELIEQRAAYSVTKSEEFSRILEDLRHDPENYRRAARTAGEYVKKHTGATPLIFNQIFTNSGDPDLNTTK